MADETPFLAETCTVLFQDFSVASLEEVRDFASTLSCKSCILDPLPALIVKGSLDTLLPVITQIVNLNVPVVIGALGSGTKGIDRWIENPGIPLDVGVKKKLPCWELLL